MELNKEDYLDIESGVKGVKLIKPESLPEKFADTGFIMLSPYTKYKLIGTCEVESSTNSKGVTIDKWYGYLIETSNKRRFAVSSRALLASSGYMDENGTFVRSEAPERFFKCAADITDYIGKDFYTGEMVELFNPVFEDGKPANGKFVKKAYYNTHKTAVSKPKEDKE